MSLFANDLLIVPEGDGCCSMSEDLGLKKEKVPVERRVGLVADTGAEDLIVWLMVMLDNDSCMVSKGSIFSFVGEGRMPIFIGSDSPLNQFASLPPLSSILTSPGLSPVSNGRNENLLRVGEDWRGSGGECLSSILSE